jgi:hypothetical protein
LGKQRSADPTRIRRDHVKRITINSPKFNTANFSAAFEYVCIWKLLSIRSLNPCPITIF